MNQQWVPCSGCTIVVKDHDDVCTAWRKRPVFEAKSWTQHPWVSRCGTSRSRGFSGSVVDGISISCRQIRPSGATEKQVVRYVKTCFGVNLQRNLLLKN